MHIPGYISQLALKHLQTATKLNDKTSKGGHFDTLPYCENHNVHDAFSSKLVPPSGPCCLCLCTRPDPVCLHAITNTHHLQLVQLVPQFRLPQPQLSLRRSLVLQRDRHQQIRPLRRSRRSLPPLRHTTRPRRVRSLLLIMWRTPDPG